MLLAACIFYMDAAIRDLRASYSNIANEWQRRKQLVRTLARLRFKPVDSARYVRQFDRLIVQMGLVSDISSTVASGGALALRRLYLGFRAPLKPQLDYLPVRLGRLL
ncbi:hypothetical protein BN2476_350240 [Paraburkholderia piptadeniae]|uniref:Uncharacterized protein n=1 Tax=Paraburkholderia piptadeniae TaxID=1701573 RepID=A0A1N7S8F7_9BURK|nr:hypothetical protein BN2476_350240 [Paraburkholderia piptadeniae]